MRRDMTGSTKKRRLSHVPNTMCDAFGDEDEDDEEVEDNACPRLNLE